MKKSAPQFKELGFRKGSSLSVQRAFFKHLVKAAEVLSHQNSFSISEQKNKTKKQTEPAAQLSFDPEVLKAGND